LAYRDAIRRFLEKEIYQTFIQKPAPKDELLRYAAACAKTVQEVCPEIHAELAGVAEGSGLTLEEATLITLHEELYHRGALPKVGHCTAVAVGPPDTTGHTYVGQTWDWMESVYGLSSVIEWQRSDGPSVLAYGYPGLWVGAGLNSAGLALTWTSASLGDKSLGARVGLPSYVLLTHLLYQQSLEDVVREARRDRHAGWFTFVMADGEGNLLNVEGSPKGIAIERSKGRLARVGFGSRQMTGTADGQPVAVHTRCQKMYDLLAGSAGKTDRQTLARYFGAPECGICVGKGTIDMMIFDTTERVAWLSRGPSYVLDWKEFRFSSARGDKLRQR
jgi:isopenicillin-N N-acyltransferase-like protein